jgi:hypothetical protein
LTSATQTETVNAVTTPTVQIGQITSIGTPDTTLGVGSYLSSQAKSGTTSEQFGFMIALSTPTPHTVTVNYYTQNGSAKAGTDYTAIGSVGSPATVTFTAGQQYQEVDVTVLPNSAYGSTLNFSVVVSSAVNAKLSNGTSTTGTITNPFGVAAPSASIGTITTKGGPLSSSNGNFKSSGTKAAGSLGFIIALSAPVSTVPGALPVVVYYYTQNGSAIAGTDYTAQGTSSAPLALTFTAGQQYQEVDVPVFGPTYASNKTFQVILASATNGTVGNTYLATGTITPG